MKKQHLRWGIIGCGDVTEKKSGPAYQKVSGFELRAVMRRDRAKAEAYALRHGVPKFYSDADALINDPEVDAVYIATPPDTHLLYALKVAEAGKPCCIEKPMAPSYAACVAICEAFEAKALPLFVAYYRRSLPRFLKVKEWIDTGKIGEVRHLNWQLSRPPSEKDLSKTYNWRTDSAIAPAGYFDDLASHGLDLFAFLLGDIEEAKGLSANQQGLYTAKDAVAGIWRHENGVTGTGNWNFGSAAVVDRVDVYGSEGTIRFAVFFDEPLQLTTAEGTEVAIIPHPDNIQFFHVEHMRKHLSGEMVHPSTGRSAAQTAWVMDRILR